MIRCMETQRRDPHGNPLPIGVHYKHGAYFRVKKQVWHWLGRDYRAAVNISARNFGKSRNRPRLLADQEAGSSYRYWAKLLVKQAKNAAVRRSIPFALTEADVEAMLVESGFCCQLTGIRFDPGYMPEAHRRPLVPSIDRINGSTGYHRANVRLVCCIVNTAIGEWGEDVFAKVARAYVQRTTGLEQSA